MLWQQPQTLYEAQPTSFPLPPSPGILGRESMFNLQRSTFEVTFQPGACAADPPTHFNFCPHGVSDLHGLAKCSPPVLLASLPTLAFLLPPPPPGTQATAWEVTFLSVPVNENLSSAS